MLFSGSRKHILLEAGICQTYPSRTPSSQSPSLPPPLESILGLLKSLKSRALCARASGNGAEADSEGEGEEEEEREGKKKQRGKAPATAAAGSKLEPRQRRLLREHPLHVTIRIKTQVYDKKCILL
jgi:hypothetical protein